MAAREGISILELFLNSIIKTFWIRNISEDLSLLKQFDEPEIQQEKKLKVTPLMIINCIYNMNRSKTDNSGNLAKRFAMLKGLQAKLIYQRLKFQMFLRVHSKLKMNIIDKLPLELNSSRLPLSFQYYETVPVLMSRCLQVIK